MKNKTVKLTVCLLTFLAPIAQASDEVKHIPGFFIGTTHFDSETEFTFGVEYEYKFTQDWGAGVVFERTNDAHHGDGTAVALASLYYHPTKSIRLGVGYGEERIGGSHPHNEDLYRISSAYDFHIGDFGIAPTIAVDFIDDEEAIVVGLAITRPF
ncbi:hypothetical protein [Pseudoalteromonas distincta]|uniref:Outer membrane protein beta-barrel domain-containing protein n=1 Tax=Pseudoalteromonas distincta TaxID=77608 RepID=A0A4P9IXM9_9GAMM|nr:hypothetical protein [Pseudoalteromonas distincta]QCU73191.1 hypothetical protein FFU37_01380 [Pseudoalteromonas distincta]